MSASEREQVGRALDALRDTLSPLIDTAMTAAYGSEWPERVSEKNAARRADGRRFRVSKDDLSVMLRLLQFERIAPWSAPGGYVDPRIRAFASEVLTLRNFYAHGEPCNGEHGRLLDTASRLLALLGLQVPAGLMATSGEENPADQGTVAEPALEIRQLSRDPFWEEAARLGEAGGRLGDIWNRAGELSMSFLETARDAGYGPDAQTPPDRERGTRLALDIGRESLALLEETYQLEGDGEGQVGIALKALALAARASLIFGLDFARFYIQQQVLDVESSVNEMDAAQLEAATAEVADWTTKMALIGEVIGARTALWRTVVELAKQLNDGEAIPNVLILTANSAMEEFVDTAEERLALVRDSVMRARLLAAADPGSTGETMLVIFLRQEGEICNDLGRPDEAVRAFARADEIIDRYPGADPNLLG